MAAYYDIIIEQGATFSVDFQINNVDLTGFQARMKGRPSHPSTTVVFDLATSNAGGTGIKINYTAPNSLISVTMTATQTAAMVAPSVGVYDLEYVIGAIVTRMVEGAYRITPEVTR